MERTPCTMMTEIRIRVNGLVFAKVGLRATEGSPREFEIVVQDPRLGPFAVHEEFELEVEEGNGGRRRWSVIPFTELKHRIAKTSVIAMASTAFPLQSSEDSLESVHSEFDSGPLPRIPIEGDHTHLTRAEAALVNCGIPHQQVGGQGSQGRHWGHTTYLVADLLAARQCLQRAGFLQSAKSRYLFTDSCNGWNIRLIAKSSSCD